MRQPLHLPSRRQFIISASASAMLAAHEGLARTALAAPSSASTNPVAPARIQSLRLQTSVPLNKMKAFYRDVLGLPVLKEAASAFTVGAGASRITFTPAAPRVKDPFYHFAFNIPENKIRSALAWQQKRGSVMNTPSRLRDPAYPEQVRHFRDWDAHSVFFLDPAGNVLEYIARHTLDNAVEGSFTSRDILCVSEIAFVVDEVTKVALRLQRLAGLKPYGQGNMQFQAVGDEEGLLLILKRGRELGTGSGGQRKGRIFPTEANIKGTHALRYTFGVYPYQLIAEEMPASLP